MLVVDGKKVTESMAIMRYAARESGKLVDRASSGTFTWRWKLNFFGGVGEGWEGALKMVCESYDGYK